MSKLKALIVAAAVVLGSSGAAMAAPAVVFKASANLSGSVVARSNVSFNTRAPAVVIRDHRHESNEPAYQPEPVYQPAWTSNRNRFEQDVRVRDEQRYQQTNWLSLATLTVGTQADTNHWITMPTNDPIHAVTLTATAGRPNLELMDVRYEDGTQQRIYLPAFSRGTITVPIQTKAAPIRELVFQQLAGTTGGSFNVSAAL